MTTKTFIVRIPLCPDVISSSTIENTLSRGLGLIVHVEEEEPRINSVRRPGDVFLNNDKVILESGKLIKKFWRSKMDKKMGIMQDGINGSRERK